MHCLARVREPEGQFIFYSYAPVVVEPEQRSAIAEFVSRANFGTYIGNFELSFVTGTLQFRTSIDLEGDEDKLTSGMLRRLVYVNALTMDKYLPGIIAVLEDGLSPEEAVAAVEKP